MIKKIIKNKILKRKPNIIYNIGRDFSVEVQPRAVLIYLNHFFCHGNDRNVYHTSNYESSVIVSVLSSLGFSVDVVNCYDDPEIVVDELNHYSYDLIMGFGEIFYQLAKLQPSSKKVIYITEGEPKFSSIKENERLDYYKERHGKAYPLVRSGKYYTEKHLSIADKMIVLGDRNQFLHYNIPIYELFPTGLLNRKFSFSKFEKNDEMRFLWFGSSGLVHKGLDILLEAFSGLPNSFNCSLTVYGASKNEMKYLNKIDNARIKIKSRIDVSSREFLEVARTHQYIFSTSCSEANSTSILTGMLHGIIPVVMKNAGMDRIGGNVVYLEDFKLDYVQSKIKSLVKNYDVNRVNRMRLENLDFANENFCLRQYKKNINKILLAI